MFCASGNIDRIHTIQCVVHTICFNIVPSQLPILYIITYIYIPFNTMALALAESIDIKSTIDQLTHSGTQLKRLYNEFNQLQTNVLITGLYKYNQSQHRQYNYNQKHDDTTQLDTTIPIRSFAELDEFIIQLSSSTDTIDKTPVRGDGKTTALFVAPSTEKTNAQSTNKQPRVSLASPTIDTAISSTPVDQSSVTPLPATVQIGRKSMARRHTPGRDISDDIQNANASANDAVDNLLNESIPINQSLTSPEQSLQTPIDSRRNTRRSVVAATDVPADNDDVIEASDTEQPVFDDVDEAADDMIADDNDDTHIDSSNDNDHMINNENDYQSSNIDHTTPVIHKQKTPVKRVRQYNANGRAKGRRQTYQIIDENAPLVSEVTDMDEAGKRRSGRTQRPPLQYWTTEHIIYKRGKQDGHNRIMGSPEYIPPVKTPDVGLVRTVQKKTKTKPRTKRQ